MKHACIIPLIGGFPLGQERALGNPVDYILSYSPFKNNDSHFVNHRPHVPYIVLDEGMKPPFSVDMICGTPPCAGLSSLSGHASADAAANNWMHESAIYVLHNVKPGCYYIENAPGLAGSIGRPVIDRLSNIASLAGYVMSLYRTKSYLHGLPQVRERSFLFFWRGDKIPLLNYFNRPIQTIENLFESIPKKALQQDVTNELIPSKTDMFYRYVLEKMEGGISHSDFYNCIEKSKNPMDWIEDHDVSYKEVGKWMGEQGRDKLAKRCDFIYDKLARGGNIMRRVSIIPKGHIGAFVGHLPMMLTHHQEDRYITYREAMTIMGLPYDFELLNPKKFLNHICQNVPVGTAADIASEVKAALEGKRQMVKAKLLRQYNASQSYEIDEQISGNTLGSFL